MKNEPTQRDLQNLPSIATTLGTRSLDRTIYLHFHRGNEHWYAAAYEPDEGMFFGCIINDKDIRLKRGRWEYFTFEDLRNSQEGEIGTETSWKPRTASQIEEIAREYSPSAA